MTERQWQRLENTMQLVVEQQVKFEMKLCPDRRAFRSL
jgi:hypothetical protein